MEPGDAEGGAFGGADLSGEIGECCKVVSEQRRGIGELSAGELHAVSGVAAEADNDGVECCGRGIGRLIGWHQEPHPLGV